jgi:hypothetical protein
LKIDWRKYEWILPLSLIITVVAMSPMIANAVIWIVEQLMARYAPSLQGTRFP